MSALKLVISLEFVVHSYFKKIAVLFLLACFLLLLPKVAFAQSNATASAQSTNYQLPTTNSYQALPAYVSPQSPTYANLQVYNIMHALSCLGVGQSPIGPCVEYQMSRDFQGKISSVPVLSSVDTTGGLFGISTSLVTAVVANPPIRTSDYLASMGLKFGIINEAHAQVGGSGGGVLSPVFALWEVSRNIAYLVMILVFVVVGLMVMFRQRLNPQTVVSIQLALPGLVIGLIMITFSYFLAALISDLAFVGTNLVGYYFSLAQSSPPGTAPLVDRVANENVLSIFSRYTGIINWGNASNALNSIWGHLADPNVNRANPFELDPQKVLTYFTAMIFAQFLLPIGGMFGGPGQIAVGLATLAGFTIVGAPTLIGWTIAFIAMIVLIYSMFKLLLRLINSYLTIILYTITAPFQFLGASLPGRQGIAVNWMLDMLCNVLAFPAVLAVFYFVAFLLGPANNPTSPLTVSGAATLTGNSAFPLLGGLEISFVNVLLAFGALVAAPSIPDIICRVMNRVSQAGQMAAQELGGNVRQGQTYYGQFTGGFQGFGRDVGRVTDTRQYRIKEFRDGVPIYEIDPYHSQAGLWSRIKANFGGLNIQGGGGGMPGRTTRGS